MEARSERWGGGRRESTFGFFHRISARASYADNYLLECGGGAQREAAPSVATPSWRTNTINKIFAEAARTEALAPITAALKEGRVHFNTNNWAQDCLFYLKNNHVLLSTCFAHPAHPFSRNRRVLVLANSLAFAFFITCALHAVGLWNQLRADQLATRVIAPVVGALLQLVWDLPGAMLGSCVCASCAEFPVWLRSCCGFSSLVCLTCHLLLGLVYAIVGALLLLVLPWVRIEDVVQEFATSKLLSFLLAVPLNVFIFALLRHWELTEHKAPTCSHAAPAHPARFAGFRSTQPRSRVTSEDAIPEEGGAVLL